MMKKEFSTPSYHAALPDLAQECLKGALPRRDFLRIATLLGVPMLTAQNWLHIPSAEAQAQSAVLPTAGGNLRVAMRVKANPDPALYDRSEKSNIARHIIENLVEIGRNNSIKPNLAERWRTSEDLKKWTLFLRKDVYWSNGDEFNADDVIVNFKRWLDPRLHSPNAVRFNKLSANNIEKIDSHTVVLHLDKPDITLPENLADYTTLIVHRRFEEEGGDLLKNPVGTGAYTLKEFEEGKHAILVRHDKPYWGGTVYLEQITYLDFGDDPNAQIQALVSNRVDVCWQFGVEQMNDVEYIKGLRVLEVPTAQAGVARLRVVEKPFDNKLLRQAMQACINADQLNEAIQKGVGDIGEHHHVAPIHPDYVELPVLKQDYVKARQQLVEAGYPQGIDITLHCLTNPDWEQRTCYAIAEMLKPANIRVTVKVLPDEDYWKQWLTSPFSFTSWAHRPLGVQNLNLAYRSDAIWNETGYSNAQFDHWLDTANAQLDPIQRRETMRHLQMQLQEEAVIIQPFWRSVFMATHESVRDIYAHVAQEHHFNRVWLSR